ncbi:MAG TPA: amidohydrolase family protein [Candidatus Saccharimonadales bacterium]|nr:amidohydrolase family protein [Candidatus Saccharimonadales bacterium]
MSTAQAGPPGTGARLRPGYVNAHTHFYSGLVPLGMPAPPREPKNFVEILQLVWWRLDRALDEASLRASVRYYVAEALRHGTTSMIDHHESPEFIEGSLDVLADACQELGLRAVVCYGATERNGGRTEGKRGLSECRRFIRGNTRPLVRGAVGLHASFTVSDDTVREAGALCTELNAPMHVHVAEDAADVADAKKRGYSGPLERLRDLRALPAGSILAHGVHLNDTEVRGAGQLDCWLVQNPRSNEGNRVGYPKALVHSRKVALGTDGWNANMPEERAALLRLSAEQQPDAPADQVGRRLEAGRTLVAQLFPGADGPAKDEILIEAHDGAPDTVHRVTVAGRTVVKDGRLLTADLEEIRAHAREQAERLWKRMEAL